MTRALRMVALAVLALIPGLLVLLATTRGPGISPDSVSYVAAARSFGATGNLLSYTGQPMTIFPPGLSILLGFAERLGIEPTILSVALNALCAALLVLATYALARLTLRSGWLALVAAAFVSLSSTTVRVYAWLWTEPLFSVLVLGVLIALVVAVKQAHISAGLIALVAALVTAATLLRYVGLVLIVVAALGAWLAERTRGQLHALFLALITGAASSAGLLVVATRNASLDAGLLGDRYPGTQSIQAAIADTVAMLGSYVLPPETSTLSAAVGSTVAVVLLVGAWLVVVRRDRPMLLVVAFVVLYWAAIWWSSSSTRIDHVSDRLASPAFAPMVVLGIFAVVRIIRVVAGQASAWLEGASRSPVRGGRPELVLQSVTVLGLFGVAAILGLSLLHGVRYATHARDNGLGYNSVANLESPLAVVVDDLPGTPGVASNDPWHIYWVGDARPAVHLPPIPEEWPAGRIASELTLLQADVANGSVTRVAAFTDGQQWMDPGELAAAGLLLTPEATLPDGQLYRISAIPQ